jgi:nucleotide-binding universal stress UspA family protein
MSLELMAGGCDIRLEFSRNHLDEDESMSPHTIISYDDTRDDRDALMLGRILRDAGARLSLAYVRHAHQAQPEREQLAESEAEALLCRGATWLEDPYAERHVVLSASTGEGLGWLAGRVDGDLIVFGSEYRTRPGHVAIGRSAEALLQNGPVALALAPAGYADSPDHNIETIGILSRTADAAAIETAYSLAERLGARVVDGDRDVDLVIVGSRAEARSGHVMITSAAQRALEDVTAPVLIVARDLALRFETLVTA